MMKCDIIQDLLPSYIEKLTSLHSNEEIEKHLQTCENCRKAYKEMSASTDFNLPVIDQEEVEKLNYFKKLKKKNLTVIFLSASAALVLATAIIVFFVIGFSVSSKDVDIVYEKIDGRLEVNLTLKNGKDLLFTSKTNFIRDENDNVIGIESRYIPKGVLHNPFDDVGNEIMLGTVINADEDHQSSFIIEFKDKTMTFINGELVE